MWTCLGTRAVANARICLVIALGLNEQRKMAAGPQPTPFWTESTSGPAPPGQAPDIADLVAHLHPAVVNIKTTQTVREPVGEGQDRPFDELRRYFGELPQRQAPRHSLGFGFRITKDDYIVTNNHVIENATEIKVALSDREEFNAKVIGRDSKIDVTVLKIHATNELPVVPLGDSDLERVGGWVLRENLARALGIYTPASAALAGGSADASFPLDG